MDGGQGTQLVFLDRGVPKSKQDATIIKEYDALKERESGNCTPATRKHSGMLRTFWKIRPERNGRASRGSKGRMERLPAHQGRTHRQGIPANEIAFIQSFNNDADKRQLFDAVKDGSVRVDRLDAEDGRRNERARSTGGATPY